jgi:hypothetical protein
MRPGVLAMVFGVPLALPPDRRSRVLDRLHEISGFAGAEPHLAGIRLWGHGATD